MGSEIYQKSIVDLGTPVDKLLMLFTSDHKPSVDKLLMLFTSDHKPPVDKLLMLFTSDHMYHYHGL